LKGVRAAVEAFWAASIQEIYIDGREAGSR